MNKLFLHSNKVLHCAVHKGGSQWMSKILEIICSNYNLKMKIFEGHSRMKEYPDVDVLYDNNSSVILHGENYIGSHMIRDPRDIIISGYFYHLLHNPSEKYYDNMTYKDKLQRLSFNDGIMFEMENIGGQTINIINKWNYNNPKFIEVKYENVISNPEEMFTKIFQHWGINPLYIEHCLDIARQCHMTQLTGRKVGEEVYGAHIRNGKHGQWKDHFSSHHKEKFKSLFRNLLIKLGYEKDDKW